MEHDEVKRVSRELEEILERTQANTDREISMDQSGEIPKEKMKKIMTEENNADELDLKGMSRKRTSRKEIRYREQDMDETETDETETDETETDETDGKALDAEESDMDDAGLEENDWEINGRDRGRQADREQAAAKEGDQSVGRTNASRNRGADYRYRVATMVRPSDGLVAAFLVPVLIMIVIFAQRRIFPFGNESFLRTDMYHQYAPFFSEFQYKLKNGGSLLYSWDIGMGVNFAALYAYYLASPFNWLLILCPKSLVIEFMTYSIVLKIGLCGLSFAYYLRRHGKTQDFGIAFFGIFYALSGYMAAYSWNIMWLDCIILFPLIVLGIEKLVKERKGTLYCITLGLSILSNYYISIMICIFLVLYFAALLILEGKKTVKEWLVNIGQFSVYSLVAGGLAAVVLLPEIFALQMTASGDFNFPQTLTSYFPIFDMLARHIANVKVEIGLEHWPNIYCGVAVLMFFLLYLVCRKIPVREKAVYCGLLLIFFASFSVNALNFIWHGFHYPNSLPCRQSFIYIFLILVMCYRAYMNLHEIKWKHMAAAFWGSVCFVILAEKLVTQEHFHFSVYYVAILFLAMYAGILYLYKNKKASLNAIVLLALAVVSVEAAVNTTVTSITTTSRSAYIKDNKAVEKLVNGLPSDTFYRIEKVTRKTKNDGAWMNFPSVSLFSSTANEALTDFFKSVGCEGNTNAYSITGSTPLVDMLFSVRYGLYSEAHPDDELLEFIDQEQDTYLYRRKYTLPVGFLIPKDFEDNWQRDFGSPVTVQNDLCQVLGAPNVLNEVDVEITDSTARFTPDQTGEYFAYVSNRKVEKVTMSAGEKSKSFSNVNRGYILELGRCFKGEEVVLSGDSQDETLSVEVYYFDNSALAEVYEKLGHHPLEVTSWRDNSLEGTVTAGKTGMLFTTIPYEKGWTVYVDGIKEDSYKMMDTFLSVEIPEGSHTVRFEYEPEGLRLGALITGGCVLFLIATALGGYIWRKREVLKAPRREEDEDPRDQTYSADAKDNIEEQEI